MTEHAIQAAQRCFSNADKLMEAAWAALVDDERHGDMSFVVLLEASRELEAESIAHLCKHCGVKRRKT